MRVERKEEELVGSTSGRTVGCLRRLVGLSCVHNRVYTTVRSAAKHLSDLHVPVILLGPGLHLPEQVLGLKVPLGLPLFELQTVRRRHLTRDNAPTLSSAAAGDVVVRVVCVCAWSAWRLLEGSLPNAFAQGQRTSSFLVALP